MLGPPVSEIQQIDAILVCDKKWLSISTLPKAFLKHFPLCRVPELRSPQEDRGDRRNFSTTMHLYCSDPRGCPGAPRGDHRNGNHVVDCEAAASKLS